MGQSIMRNWDWREFHVRVNLQSPIQQVPVPIRRIITPIWGLPNPFTQVIPLMSHIRSYPPHCFHLHPHLSLCRAQLYHHCRTQSQVIPLYLSMPWSWVDTKYSINQVLYTPSTAYTEYSIHRVQHTPSTAYTEYSIHRVQHTPSTAYTE